MMPTRLKTSPLSMPPLPNSTQAASAQMYQQTGGAQGAGSNDDIQEADFEEVK